MRTIIQLIAVSAVLAILAGCAGGVGSAPAPEGTTGDARADVERGIAIGRDNYGGEGGADGDADGDAEG